MPPRLVMIVAAPAVLVLRKAVTPPLSLMIVALPAVLVLRKAATPTSLAEGTALGLVRALMNLLMLNEAVLPPLLTMVALPAVLDWLNCVITTGVGGDVGVAGRARVDEERA